MRTHIVKRSGRKEKFDERKVYASCYAACLNAHLEKKEAEKICERVANEIKSWIKNKKEVTSEQIFDLVITVIKKYDKNAAFMYETHRDIA